MSEIYLVTGANSGHGLDSVRRLAMMPSTKKVYMACHKKSKAIHAVDKLKGVVDTNKLRFVHFDATVSKEEIHKRISKYISEGDEITGLILNAGGIVSSKSRKSNDIHQINLIGHIQLVEALKASSKMAKGCKIVFSGSEAARGIPTMMIRNPKMGETSAWYEKQLKRKSHWFARMAVYAQTKGFAALYFAEWARRNPEYNVWVVSPGGGAVPSHFNLIMPHFMMPMMNAIGMMHAYASPALEDGTDRYIEALTGKNEYPSGSFIASRHGTTGEVVDQTSLKSGKKYADQHRQKAAYEALAPYAGVPGAIGPKQ